MRKSSYKTYGVEGPRSARQAGGPEQAPGEHLARYVRAWLPELLHRRRMADVYWQKVSGRCQGLARENSRLGATDAIRGLIEAIVLDPETAGS